MSHPVHGQWYKSTRSDGGNYCVEVRHNAATTLVRDAKGFGSGPILEFPAAAWSAFLASGIWER